MDPAGGQTIPAVYYQIDSLKASAEGGDPLAANILGGSGGASSLS